MKLITKLSNLLTSAIELPNALHAVAEAAREMESSRAIVSEHDGAQICGKLAARIVELERDLDREREARRWRKQSKEPAPFGKAVLERFSDGGIMKCNGQAVFEINEWRYLSPEDMPDNQ